VPPLYFNKIHSETMATPGSFPGQSDGDTSLHYFLPADYLYLCGPGTDTNIYSIFDELTFSPDVRLSYIICFPCKLVKFKNVQFPVQFNSLIKDFETNFVIFWFIFIFFCPIVIHTSS